MATLSNARIPVIGLSAPSGTGKTTLACYLIGLFNERGLRVGVIKQARADFDVDQPGKDSYRLRKAGIERLLLGSERQSGMIIEHEHATSDSDLNQLLGLFDQDTLDLILVEGFASDPFPKLELYRQAIGKPPRYPHDRWIIAVATDLPAEQFNPPPPAGVPLLEPSSVDAVPVRSPIRESQCETMQKECSENSQNFGLQRKLSPFDECTKSSQSSFVFTFSAQKYHIR